MTEREKFEAWARQSDTCPLLNRADHNGTELDDYHFPLARAMWETWQAARATPALPHILQDIAENSVPLGAEFEAAMMKNLSSMYEYDGKPQALPQGVGEWIEARLPLARDSRGRGSKK